MRGPRRAGRPAEPEHQLPADALSDTFPNVSLALLPRAVMAKMHTTMIRASMTAYSTAVGPSSFFRKRTVFFNIARYMSRYPPRLSAGRLCIGPWMKPITRRTGGPRHRPRWRRPARRMNQGGGESDGGAETSPGSKAAD